MTIPNADSAFVPAEKLQEYLLNLNHPIGGPKARWFISLGYTRSQSERLRADLLEVVRTNSNFMIQSTPFGVQNVVHGQMVASNGSLARVRTVWISVPGVSSPRLVTAYPDQGAENE